MAGPFDLTGQNIENTYQRVLQTPDGTNIYDGTGSLFTVTAVAAPAGPSQSIQFNDAGTTSGSGNFTFDKINNIVNLTGSLINNGLTYPLTDNGEFSFIQTDGNGNLSLQYVNTLYEIIYNGEATQIAKGTPVYISGSQGANSIAYRADAGDPTKMPVVYVAADNIDPSSTGRAIALGLITGVNTTGYPGGTEIYVAVGGGWTSSRPTGSAIIQVLGYVTKEGNGGQGVVLNPGPANLPNLPSGSVWVGNNDSIPVTISTSSLRVDSSSFSSISNQLFVSQSVANTNFKLLFASTGDGNKDVLQDSGTDGTYNPWTNTLTATNLAGTATNATNVNIATNSTNTNYYVTFGFGAGNNRVTIDGGGQFTYNPSTNILTVPTVVGNLTGTATTASSTPNALITASVSSNTITFTKGDGSTFPIIVDTGSGGGPIDVGAFVTTSSFNTYTGSNASQFAGTASFALTSSYVNPLYQNVSLSGSLNVSQSVTADSLTVNNFSVVDTLGIGDQIFYTQGEDGFSVNEDFNVGGPTQTAYHFTSGDVNRSSVVFSLARTTQFTNMFGVTGSSSDNKFVIGAEFGNTDFEWRTGLGVSPVQLQGGTLLARLNRFGSFWAQSISGSLTGSLLGTASWADNYNETDPIFVAKSASLATTGSNLFNGNQTITGSLTVTGSFFVSNSIDSDSRTLYDSAATSSVNWESRVLYDGTGTNASVDWNSGVLNDSNGALSVSWGGRTLRTPAGNRALAWGANNYVASSQTYQERTLSTEIQDEFSNNVLTYSGQAISAVIDGGSNIGELVYLQTSGKWLPVTQSLSNASHMLGINLDGGSTVLLEGDVVLDNMQGPSYGRPMYIKEGDVVPSSTQPTSGYIRVLGYCYYENQTTAGQWILKFKPSNDWYKI